jgi:NAD(P)H dehydrogenase (quinone)
VQTQANGIAIEKAIVAARPDKVVFLSTVGGQVAEPNLLNNSKMTEETLRQLPVPVAFLRADGLNEGWIDFERAGEQRQGIITIDTVIAGLIGEGEAA